MEQGKMFTILGITMAILQGSVTRRLKTDMEASAAMMGVIFMMPAFFVLGFCNDLTTLAFGLFCYSIGIFYVNTINLRRYIDWWCSCLYVTNFFVNRICNLRSNSYFNCYITSSQNERARNGSWYFSILGSPGKRCRSHCGVISILVLWTYRGIFNRCSRHASSAVCVAQSRKWTI